MTKRINPIGLNKYDCIIPAEEIGETAKYFRERLGININLSDEILAHHGFVTAESGWDMNPRWDFEGCNYVHVDLNSLLYLFEQNMAYFSSELNKNESEIWNNRSKKRSDIMNEYMVSRDNLFYDYNYINKSLGKVFFAASFYPLFAKLATKEQAEAAVKNLCRIEEKYRIICCEKNDCGITYQWDYPNGWACLQYIVIKALENYGYYDYAETIGKKYTSLVENVFENTGGLWEKYNVVCGNINVKDEYKMPPMLGWSAGVYLAVKDMI